MTHSVSAAAEKSTAHLFDSIVEQILWQLVGHIFYCDEELRRDHSFPSTSTFFSSRIISGGGAGPSASAGFSADRQEQDGVSSFSLPDGFLSPVEPHSLLRRALLRLSRLSKIYLTRWQPSVYNATTASTSESARLFELQTRVAHCCPHAEGVLQADSPTASPQSPGTAPPAAASLPIPVKTFLNATTLPAFGKPCAPSPSLFTRWLPCVEGSTPVAREIFPPLQQRETVVEGPLLPSFIPHTVGALAPLLLPCYASADSNSTVPAVIVQVEEEEAVKRKKNQNEDYLHGGLWSSPVVQHLCHTAELVLRATRKISIDEASEGRNDSLGPRKRQRSTYGGSPKEETAKPWLRFDRFHLLLEASSLESLMASSWVPGDAVGCISSAFSSTDSSPWWLLYSSAQHMRERIQYFIFQYDALLQYEAAPLFFPCCVRREAEGEYDSPGSIFYAQQGVGLPLVQAVLESQRDSIAQLLCHVLQSSSLKRWWASVGRSAAWTLQRRLLGTAGEFYPLRGGSRVSLHSDFETLEKAYETVAKARWTPSNGPGDGEGTGSESPFTCPGLFHALLPHEAVAVKSEGNSSSAPPPPPLNDDNPPRHSLRWYCSLCLQTWECRDEKEAALFTSHAVLEDDRFVQNSWLTAFHAYTEMVKGEDPGQAAVAEPQTDYSAVNFLDPTGEASPKGDESELAIDFLLSTPVRFLPPLEDVPCRPHVRAPRSVVEWLKLVPSAFTLPKGPEDEKEKISSDIEENAEGNKAEWREDSESRWPMLLTACNSQVEAVVPTFSAAVPPPKASRLSGAKKMAEGRLRGASPRSSALDREAWEEVGTVLASISEVFQGRTIIDNSAGHYGRNVLQMANYTSIGLASRQELQQEEEETPIGDISAMDERKDAELLGEVEAVFFHEPGLLYTRSGLTFAMETFEEDEESK